MKSDLSKTVTLLTIAIFLFLSTFWITIRIAKVEEQVTHLQGQLVSQSLKSDEQLESLTKDLVTEEMLHRGGCFALDKTENVENLSPFLGRRLKIGACRLEEGKEPVNVIYAVDAGSEDEASETPDGGMTIEAIKTIFAPR